MISVHREGVTGHGVTVTQWGRGKADSDSFFMLTGSNFTGENI